MKKLISTLLFLFVVAIISLSAQTDIYAPTLLEPEDGDDDQMPNVVLDWAAVAGSGGEVTYDLQLDVTVDFTNPVSFNDLEFSASQMEDLLFAQQYYWRVRAKEGSEVSDWSDPFNFVIFETVVLNKPNDEADEQAPNVDLKVKDRFGANLITGVDHFEFEADTSANFDSPLLFTGMSESAVLPASFLHFGTIYYWHARATHAADNSIWSEVRTFEVVPTVILDEPGNSSTGLGLENELVWEEITGVLDYKVQLADNDAFTGAFSIMVEETEYITDGFITFGTEYWWRVQANHATDTSDFSEAFNFATINTVLLSMPEDEAVDVGITPLLEWEELTGVDTFYLVYGDTPGLENPIDEVSIAGDQFSFQIIYILEKDQNYYWKCRALNGIDTTTWSDTWIFTTEPEVGINEPFDESNISIYPNPSHGKLIIDVASEENTEVSIYIMDLLGQVHVEEVAVFGQGNSIRSFDLSNLANGLYLVRLNSGDHTYTHKITIHK